MMEMQHYWHSYGEAYSHSKAIVPVLSEVEAMHVVVVRVCHTKR